MTKSFKILPKWQNSPNLVTLPTTMNNCSNEMETIIGASGKCSVNICQFKSGGVPKLSLNQLKIGRVCYGLCVQLNTHRQKSQHYSSSKIRQDCPKMMKAPKSQSSSPNSFNEVRLKLEGLLLATQE